MNQMNQELPLIETVHLKKYFDTGSGLLHAVDDVNLTIQPRKMLTFPSVPERPWEW